MYCSGVFIVRVQRYPSSNHTDTRTAHSAGAPALCSSRHERQLGAELVHRQRSVLPLYVCNETVILSKCAYCSAFIDNSPYTHCEQVCVMFADSLTCR